MPEPFSQIYRKSPDIVARLIADEMILVPIRKSVADLESIYMLNETALTAWNLFDGSRNLGEVRRHIMDAYNVDEATAEQDLLELVDNLVRVGALVKA